MIAGGKGLTKIMSLPDGVAGLIGAMGRRNNELVLDWHCADAKWFDRMRLHVMSEAYRLVLRFDDGARNARAQDRYASFDWSGGRGPSLVEAVA